jgi:hypothetical protein
MFHEIFFMSSNILFRLPYSDVSLVSSFYFLKTFLGVGDIFMVKKTKSNIYWIWRTRVSVFINLGPK